MTKRIIGIFFLSILVPGLLACSPGASEAMLQDGTWRLESYGEPGNLKTVIQDTEISAEFDGSKETIKGSAGCNHYSGSYEVKGGQLTIPGPLAATEMYCMEPPGVMDQEQEYLTILQLAESYEINGEELQINCGGQVLILKRD